MSPEQRKVQWCRRMKCSSHDISLRTLGGSTETKARGTTHRVGLGQTKGTLQTFVTFVTHHILLKNYI